ncbi:MAG: sugar ABC transporter permease [Candidatus Atribacteria bacterium]|nr:sugar ABC transporter permease [Candidatus Atribacteria bacterium]
MVNHSKKSINQYAGYIYLLPGLAWIFFVFAIPIIQLIGMSIRQGPVGQEILGFDNFIFTFRDPLFIKAITNNIKLLVIVPILIILSLIFSTFLYERIKGWQIYQTIIFIPVILAVAAMGIVFSQILQLKGLLNETLRVLRLNFLIQDWLGNQGLALGSVVGVIVWKELGFGTILFLARLMSVDKELYEAARIDGASGFQLMIHITIPQLIHIIEFYAVLLIVTAFSFVFDYILILTNGGPNNQTIVGEFFVYKYGFIYNRFNIASSVAIVYLLVGIVLMILRYQIVKRIDS